MLPSSANTIYINRRKSGSNKTGKMPAILNAGRQACRTAGLTVYNPERPHPCKPANRLSHCFWKHSPSQNYFPKQKKRKKRKPFGQGGQAEKPKGNGISPEGWRSHYVVSFWLDSARGVRLSFAAFLFFFEIQFRP